MNPTMRCRLALGSKNTRPFACSHRIAPMRWTTRYSASASPVVCADLIAARTFGQSSGWTSFFQDSYVPS
jgi:hypothetical protein